MTTTLSGTTLTFSSGTTWTTKPSYSNVGGTYWSSYGLGSYVMVNQLNPKTLLSYLNNTPLVSGIGAYIIPWPTNYYPYAANYGPYTGASNYNTVSGFITSTSSAVNFPTTNTNYYALAGTWRAAGWAGDGADTDFQYFYQLFRRVA
jgi:hypothetical protein